MPHTSRKKRTSTPAQKRLQVTDDEGWTHVTSGSNARRVIRTTRGQVPRDSNSKSKSNSDTATQEQHDGEKHPQPDEDSVLNPAEAPARLTLPELQAQYAAHRERWMESETWKTLTLHLTERMRERERLVSTPKAHEASVSGPVDAIVCIGLGSPSGFLRGGWVDRRTVSMYQLAALECIKEQLSRPDNNLPLSFPVYAQDPVFNSLDHALLTSLGITVLTHPSAFARVTTDTLLFCPGAERKHLELVLPANPCLVVGGPLEQTESEVIQSYMATVGSRALVPFSLQEHAFWRMRLYFRVDEEEES